MEDELRDIGLGFLAATCGDSTQLARVTRCVASRSINGMSLPWIMQIGHDAGAWVRYDPLSVAPQPWRSNALRHAREKPTITSNGCSVIRSVESPITAGAVDLTT